MSWVLGRSDNVDLSLIATKQFQNMACLQQQETSGPVRCDHHEFVVFSLLFSGAEVSP